MTVKIEIFGENAHHAFMELRDFAGGFMHGAQVPAPVVDDVENGAVRRAAPEGRQEPAADEDDGDMKPVRGKNAEVLAASILSGNAGPEHTERLPKKLQDEVRAKIGAPTQAAEPEPAIRATPEDRRDPEIEDAEIVGDDDAPAATRQDLLDAMSEFAEKHGMADAKAKLPQIMGYEKQSMVPDDQIGAVLAKVKAAI